ncbi:MFS transporter [Candidatus Puniceispirillum sp.]|nr:MFS transporter [Alphaproteobacteria bacterium]MDC1294139.1 MFS transporter [Candidatus Puniceispirillum sp.]
MAIPSPSFARDLRLTITILFCGTLSGINIAKLAPSINELSISFGLSLSQIGLLASVFTLIMVLVGVLIGGIVRGAGTKRILMAALIIACIGNAISLMGSSVTSLFIGRAIEGVSLIALTLTAPSLLAQHTDPANRGWVMGTWGGFMPLGNGLAIIAAPYLIEQGGWHLVWQVGFGFSVFVCGLGWLFIPDDRSPMRRQFDLAVLKLAIALPLLAIIGLSFALHSLVYQTLIQFMPLISQSLGGFSLSEGAMITGLFCAVNFVGNLIAGQALQTGKTPAHIVRFVFSSVLILLILLVLFSQSAFLLVLVLILTGLVSGGSAPIFFYLVSRTNDDPQNLPIFVAWVFQIQGLGMLIGPALISWVVETTQSWNIGILCLIPACLAIIALSGRLVLPDAKTGHNSV